MARATYQSASRPGQWPDHERHFAAYLAGDSQAADQVFTAFGRILMSFFLARTGSEADSQDLTQITLLKIHVSRASFDPALALKTWVFVVAERSLIDHWRRAGRRDSVLSLVDSEATFENHEEKCKEDALELMAKKKILGQALEILKPEDRSLVYLNVEEGLSMADLAMVFGSSEGAIKVRLHRARKALRQWLERIDSSHVVDTLGKDRDRLQEETAP